MKSLIILFVCYYGVSGQTRPTTTNTVEEQLRTLQAIEQTKWAEIKSMIEVQDRRFDQFEKMIDTIDQRVGRITDPNAGNRRFEVCVSPNDKSSSKIGIESAPSVGDICSDSWSPFRREKCYKFYDESKTYAEAVDHCKRQSPAGSSATLASIRNAEEQAFVENYLFAENRPDDNVWLGVKRNPQNRSLVWEDGSGQRYTNWDVADNFVEGNDCVEMQKETPIARDRRQGMWKSAQCRGRNLILCSYTPPKQSTTRPQTKPTGNRPVTRPWPPSSAQEVGGSGSGETFGVPYGFVYIQLPSQSEPTHLWPNYNWEEVSRLYAGQFFRVEGGGSARFGVAQNESFPRMHHIQSKKRDTTAVRGVVYQDDELRLPADSAWSDYIYTGDRDYERHETRYLRFSHTSDEVRPRNQAIRVWKRV